MRELVRRFPLSLLDFFKGKVYDSMLDFILDVLYACGIDVEQEISNLLCKLFKVDEEGYFTPDMLYNKLATTNMKVESKFIDNLEDAVKVSIIESLLAVLGGCSVIPEIKNEHMDKITYSKKNLHVLTRQLKSTTGKNVKIPRVAVYKMERCNVRFKNYEDAGMISIPINSIDVFGKLRISPCSSTGSCIYDLDSSPTFTSELAYTYYKAIFNENGNQEIKYFLTKQEAEEFVKKRISEGISSAQSAGVSYNSVDNYIKERKAGYVTESITSYEEALRAAGYIAEEDRGGDIKELYQVLIKADPKYGQKSFYKKFITMSPPMAPGDLYKSKDLDAVLWYTMYRGNTVTQQEKNKMVWDNRRYKNPRTQEEWAYWLESKKSEDSFIYQEVDKQFFDPNNDGKAEFGEQVDEPSSYSYNGIFPIMQIQRDPLTASEDRLAVSISAQRYYRGSMATTFETGKSEGKNVPKFSIIRFNHTMYKFNYDYMRSIKIFNAKAILAGMLNQLLNGSLFADFGITFSYGMQVVEAQIAQVVKTAIETDEFLSSDCYFRFSNDEYDMMLHREELNRYSAKDVNSPGMPAAVVDPNDVLDMMQEANTSATPSGTINTIQRTINTVTATPSSNAIINFEGNVAVNGGHLMQFLYNIIMAIIRPILMCIFAPKVMLIFILNFHVAGLIDITDPNSLSDIQELILKKIFSILKCLVKLLIQKIVGLLLELFYQYIMPILSSFIIEMLLEYVEKWLKLLKDALQCIPMFNWNKFKLNASIDDVNYADIINNNQSTPQSTTTC